MEPKFGTEARLCVMMDDMHELAVHLTRSCILQLDPWGGLGRDRIDTSFADPTVPSPEQAMVGAGEGLGSGSTCTHALF